MSLKGCGSIAARQGVLGTAAELNVLKLVNWYPHDAPWSRLWTDATEEEITNDFVRIAGLGANAVRVIVNPYTFGYPTALAVYERKLRWIVDTADRHHLQVQLTLFDFWEDYAAVEASTTWMQKVVGPYKNDRRLCFLEIKNEINPVDERVVTWLQAIYPATKAAIGSIPVTVSVTSGIGMPEVLQWVATARTGLNIDFINIHWYGDSAETSVSFAQMKAACGTVPLYIGETGQSSQPNGSQTAAEAEAAQAAYLSSTIAACRANGLPLPAPWVWQDFTTVALPFVGGVTSQLAYGLLRLDGSQKPAYAVVEQAFA